MNPDYIREIAKALRLAADALERGEPIDHVARTVDGTDWHESAHMAREDALNSIVAEDGEYHPDVGSVSWGVYVPVEVCKIEVVPDDYYGEHQTPQDHGYDEWWETSLESPWKEAEIEMADEHAKLKATVAQYLAAWEEDDGVQKTIQRETMKQIVHGLGVPEDLLTGPVEYATASKSIQQARRQWEKDARRPSLLEIAMKRAEEVNPRINKETNLLRSVSVTNAHELDIAGHVILSLLQQLHYLQQKYTQAVTGSPAPFVAFTSTTGAPWVEMSSDITKKGPDNGST